MPDTAPLTGSISAAVPAVAAGSDDATIIGVIPYNATITSINYAPDTGGLTGANTDSRTLSVVNKGQDGAGSTSIASKAFTSGVNAAAFDETALTLSGTAANLNVAQNDVIAFVSTHVGSTGLAEPGGRITVNYVRR